MVARVGSQYWVLSRSNGTRLLDDAEAVEFAVRTGLKLAVFDTLEAAASDMRARLAAGDD
jgi:hypothetical protein